MLTAQPLLLKREELNSHEEGELKTGEVLDDLMFTLILHGPNQNNYLDVKL